MNTMSNNQSSGLFAALDFIDFLIGGALAVGGAIFGYLLGVALYITILSSSAFTSSVPILAAATNSGTFPILFAFGFAALGFFVGVVWSASHSPNGSTSAQTIVITIPQAALLTAATAAQKEQQLAPTATSPAAGPPS